MIAVIADDLTGAAELGGIGLRHGLRTEIRTAVAISTTADLLVIAADTRSKQEKAAVEEMTTLTRQLRALHPEWIYKKTDSVLRGHVIAEIKAHLLALDFQSALLVPANPSLGRTVRDGKYYLDDQPIHTSAFSIDPEFPIHSSDLQDMLHTRRQPVLVRKTTGELPVRGIIVGEVKENADLRSWALRIPSRTLAAGAAGFFSALLDVRVPGGQPADDHPPVLGSPVLFISGTTFESNRAAIRRQAENGGPVCYMPDTPDDAWEENVINLLQTKHKAIIAIDDGHHGHTAPELRKIMATVVNHILQKFLPAELFIEGGATAYAILQHAGWHTFVPEQELAPGVIRMSVPAAPGIFITVKPGSYRYE
jgi:D-threonate/D-erythronate kinase